jgi:hypothetical protein
MGLASLGGRTFRLDPTSINWTYQVKVADLKTVGGKVVQVYGAELGDLVVTGAFGVGGWKEQLKWLGDLKKIAEQQVTNALTSSTADPITFSYPPNDWTFLVYLKEFSDPAGGTSVVYDNANFNPKWTITMMIADDGEGRLKTVAMDSFISRLSEGIGWKRTEYNGLLTPDELEAQRQGLPLHEAFGLAAGGNG